MVDEEKILGNLFISPALTLSVHIAWLPNANTEGILLPLEHSDIQVTDQEINAPLK